MPWSAITQLANDFGLPTIIIIVSFFIFRSYYVYISRADKLRVFKHDEIKLLSEVLSGQMTNKKFLLEQMIEAKYKHLISWREIDFLMLQHSPSEALSLYADTKSCIEFPYTEKAPSFRGKLKKEFYRKVRKIWHVGLYFFFCFLSLFLIWASPFIYENQAYAASFLFAVIPSFILFAIFSLKEYAEINKAERLMSLIEYSKNNPQKSIKNKFLLL